MPFKTTVFSKEQLDDVYFKLLSQVVYTDKEYGLRIVVSPPFVCDGPSVVRIPVVFLLYANRGIIAAVIHDFLYRNVRLLSHILTEKYQDGYWYNNIKEARKVADRVYLHALRELPLMALPNIRAIGRFLMPGKKMKNWWDRFMDNRVIPVVNYITAFNMYLGVRMFGWKFVGKEEGCIDPRLFCDKTRICTDCENHDTEARFAITLLSKDH